jgi:YfaZ precursor
MLVIKSNRRPVTSAVLLGWTIALFLLADAGSCHAQASPAPQDAYLLAANGLDPGVASDSGSTSLPITADPAAPTPPQVGTPPADDGWHFAVSPYLWFPGFHGTFAGPNRAVGVHASATDLISHLRIGLMGAVEARHKRLLLPLDLVWVRLGKDRDIPMLPPPATATSANMTGTLFFLTPKVGVRLIDAEKIKIDALAGFRYWYFGENLKFSPSALNLNFSRSQDWVDPLVGGRIQLALTEKIAITAFGDVGGWGVGSQLEYQAGGLLGYKIKQNWTLQAGYRYINFDYRANRARTFVVNTTVAGVVAGLTYTFD